MDSHVVQLPYMSGCIWLNIPTWCLQLVQPSNIEGANIYASDQAKSSNTIAKNQENKEKSRMRMATVKTTI
jgi:hypothetical protein